MRKLIENKSKCLIIQSEFSEFSFWNYVDVCKIIGAKYPSAPLGLLTVAALLPQHWIFKLVDANITPVLDEHFEWADIVCLGGMLPQQPNMLSLIDRAHQFNLPVVVGGPDPTSQPELYQSADYLVLGEGEVTIPLFIADLEKGLHRGQYQSIEKADMTEAVVPRFDLIRFRDYLQMGIQYSRGCPFHCEFCNIVELFGRNPRTKTSEQVLLELQTLYNLGYRGHIDIVDDNFIGHKKNVKKLLTDIREWSEQTRYPFYFSTECSINLVDDESLMQMMRDVDFRYVFIGIETPEESALIMANKNENINKSTSAVVKTISSYGMIVNAGFIIGFDQESNQIADNMIRCIQDSGISMAMLGLLYALPNTRLSKRLMNQGRLFEYSSAEKENQILIDQTTTGLNFMTDRPRLNILNDYLCIEKFIYDPENYFDRVTTTAFQLEWIPKFKPGFFRWLKTGMAFIKVSLKLGKDRQTAWSYYKMLFRVLLKNARAIEPAVSLSAMFIHFHRQSMFIIKHIDEEIIAQKRFQQEQTELLFKDSILSRMQLQTEK
ncbi:MAG: B12-binding domain-containing radical SAM protein [candidate division KSB1 bacterium]|nr:B12-binding domain-containing radical SAM protein [candidate division KSB1 bacterium]